MEQRLIDVNKIYSEVQNSASDTDTEKDMKALFRYLLRTAQTVLTIPDNPTNGNMQIALYPNLKYVIQNGRVVTTIGVGASFDLEWWNAPYEKETKND